MRPEEAAWFYRHLRTSMHLVDYESILVRDLGCLAGERLVDLEAYLRATPLTQELISHTDEALLRFARHRGVEVALCPFEAPAPPEMGGTPPLRDNFDELGHILYSLLPNQWANSLLVHYGITVWGSSSIEVADALRVLKPSAEFERTIYRLAAISVPSGRFAACSRGVRDEIWGIQEAQAQEILQDFLSVPMSPSERPTVWDHLMEEQSP